MIGTFGGVYILRHSGLSTEWETHPFDHLSLVTKGVLKFEWCYPDAMWEQLGEKGQRRGRTKSGELVFSAPATVPVLAGVLHKLTGLSPEGFEVWCIHATRDAEGVVIGSMTLDKYLGSDNV